MVLRLPRTVLLCSAALLAAALGPPTRAKPRPPLARAITNAGALGVEADQPAELPPRRCGSALVADEFEQSLIDESGGGALLIAQHAVVVVATPGVAEASPRFHLSVHSTPARERAPPIA